MSRPSILVTSRSLLDRRDAWADGYELVALDEAGSLPAPSVAAGIRVIVCGGEPLDPRSVDALPNLELVACFATGYAGIDVAQLRSRQIAITTARGVNAHDVADHAIALMLGWWHSVVAADRAVRDGRWREVMAPRQSLRGKRAGIVGLGRIGLEIARRAEALGLSVSWWGPRDKPAIPYPRAENLVALARESDILIVSSRAVPANTRQIDHDVLVALGAQGLLVNVSRGFLVDEAALIQALRNGVIAGAALDVFWDEPTQPERWAPFNNVLLSPHIAGYTREAGIALFAQLRENLRRHFAGEPLLTPLTDDL